MAAGDGGEAIYGPLTPDDDLAEKLASIGRVVFVRFRADVKALRGFSDNPVGVTALSYWHRSIRPDACPWFMDFRLNQPVAPDDVLDVVPMRVFQHVRRGG